MCQQDEAKSHIFDKPDKEDKNPYLAAQGLAKTILDFLDQSDYYNKSGEQEQLELPLFF